jgi:hypothetical protein
MANMDVNAVVTATTSDFDTKMLKSGQVATATSRAIEKAAKQSAAAQAFADKFIGDSVDDRSIRIVKAGQRQVEASADLRKANALMKQGLLDEAKGAEVAAAALQRLTAATLARQAAAESHGSVSQQQAASAAVRGLEGNVGIRSVERFLITMPGVGKVLQGIFPLIGAAAFTGIIVKMGTELYDLEQKGKHAGEELERAFGEMNQKLEVSNDQLELTNSKLRDEIGILSKKPTNGAETALLSATVAADKLQESLAGDLKALAALLKEHDVSFFEGTLANVGTTGKSSKEITDQAKLLERQGMMAKAEYGKQLADAGASQAKQEAATKAYYGRMEAIAAEAARKMRQRATEVANDQKRIDQEHADAQKAANRGGGIGPGRALDLTAQRSAFEDAAVTFDDVQRRAQLSGQNYLLEATKGALEGQKRGAADSSRAAELKFKAMETEIAQMKLLGNDSLKAEYDFWDARRNAFAKGSAQYQQVVEKQAALAVDGAHRAAQAIAKARKAGEKDDENHGQESAERGIFEYQKEATKAAQEVQRANDNRADAANELAAQRQRNSRALAEIAVNEAAGRSITENDAAVRTATIHTAMYGLEMDRLNEKARAIGADSSKGAAQKEEEIGRLQLAAENLNAARTQQITRDAAALSVPDSSAVVGAKDALNEFTDAARDNAGQMRRLVSESLSAVNGSIMNGSGWRQTASTIARSAGGTLLTKAEGTVLEALGFGSKGKPDGTSANPLHVMLANMQGLNAPSLTANISNVMGSGFSLKKLGSSMFGNLIPGFASGVDNFGGGMAMVGEEGPELLNLPRGSSITPNHKIRAGGDSHTINVDARGSNDPAGTVALVKQGLTEAMPHIVKAAAQFSQDNSRRTPRR